MRDRANANQVVIAAIVRRKGKKYFRDKFWRELAQSTLFLTTNGTLKLAGFYFYPNAILLGIPACGISLSIERKERKLVGSFYYVNTLAFIPSMMATLVAIILERKSRRGLLAMYTGNLILFDNILPNGRANRVERLLEPDLWDMISVLIDGRETVDCLPLLSASSGLPCCHIETFATHYVTTELPVQKDCRDGNLSQCLTDKLASVCGAVVVVTITFYQNTVTPGSSVVLMFSVATAIYLYYFNRDLDDMFGLKIDYLIPQKNEDIPNRANTISRPLKQASYHLKPENNKTKVPSYKGGKSFGERVTEVIQSLCEVSERHEPVTFGCKRHEPVTFGCKRHEPVTFGCKRHEPVTFGCKRHEPVTFGCKRCEPVTFGCKRCEPVTFGCKRHEPVAFGCKRHEPVTFGCKRHEPVTFGCKRHEPVTYGCKRCEPVTFGCKRCEPVTFGCKRHEPVTFGCKRHEPVTFGCKRHEPVTFGCKRHEPVTFGCKRCEPVTFGCKRCEPVTFGCKRHEPVTFGCKITFGCKRHEPVTFGCKRHEPVTFGCKRCEPVTFGCKRCEPVTFGCKRHEPVTFGCKRHEPVTFGCKRHEPVTFGCKRCEPVTFGCKITFGCKSHEPVTFGCKRHEPVTFGCKRHEPVTFGCKRHEPVTFGCKRHEPVTFGCKRHEPVTFGCKRHEPVTFGCKRHEPVTFGCKRHEPVTFGCKRHEPVTFGCKSGRGMVFGSIETLPEKSDDDEDDMETEQEFPMSRNGPGPGARSTTRSHPALNMVAPLLRAVEPMVSWLKHRPSHPVCQHKHSCAFYVIQGAVRMFGIGYGVQAVIKLLSSLPGVFKRPKTVISALMNKANVQLGAFLASLVGIYRALNCVLRWLRDRDDSLHGLVAGFVAGWSMMYYKSSTIALYTASKVAEAVLEPHNLRPAYWKFLMRVTGNKFAGMNRRLLDPYITNCSKLYPDYWPDYDMRFTNLVKPPAS
ncbi:TM135-like protein [Mya arenaria]|uniref:TM135-like protein n=1 Tax=Mya arenaria TaxID=6604 RepID=A0ABY7EG39_MYAAR|nr:TM135-like protein [Mya arenaria]